MDFATTSGLIDWEHLTGQSKFVIDIISVPLFSAFAGLITNWTGVIMLFSPARFTGFHVPGLTRLFPILPRKVQILPIFAPGGILGLADQLKQAWLAFSKPGSSAKASAR